MLEDKEEKLAEEEGETRTETGTKNFDRILLYIREQN